MSDTPQNNFTHGALGPIYVRTALPIIFVMGMNGLLSVADALFLGHFVGADALAAVTLMFPVYMLIVALSTLVSNGMSSQLARNIGAGNHDKARAVFAGAHGLALCLSVVLILLILLLGEWFARLVAGGSAELAEMGLVYLRITVLFSPLMFVLGVNSDTLRNEGRVGFMAAMSLLVSIANIAFNYVLIAWLDMGVAGSAYGTVLAQLLGFGIILGFRLRGQTEFRPSALFRYRLTGNWPRMLALGAPQSLGFIGLSLASASVVAALQLVETPSYDATISAYGIVTRALTFAYLPLLGLSFAMQTITGNNYGASLWHRSNLSLKVAIGAAFIYCTGFQIGLTAFAGSIGAGFVDDPQVIAEIGRILPVIVAMFWLAGPLMMISTYFQAIGDASRAAILSLSKTYLFSIPLTYLFALKIGEAGIWLAGPVSEGLLLILTIGLLAQTARGLSFKWGLFRRYEEAV